MSESSIRSQIYTIFAAVPNIGKVYDYERWAVDWAAFINLFKATIGGVDQIRGWEIGRRSYKESRKTLGIGNSGNEGVHGYLIRGYMAINDAAETEKTLNALMETGAEAFRGNKTLNGVAIDHDFLQVDLIEPRTFGGILCHYAEVSLIVYERI